MIQSIVFIVCEGKCDRLIALIRNSKSGIVTAADWNRAELIDWPADIVWPVVRDYEKIEPCPICGGRVRFEPREGSCEANGP